MRYEYADGRFAAVVRTNRGESTGYRADYADLAGSCLLAALTNSSGMTWTRSYEAQRDLLTAVENRNGTNLLSRYDYANDALARRTDRVDSPGNVANSFDYNERSELISALMGTNVYAYEFDPIGNRRSASRLEAAAAMTNLYAANPLNQYTSILRASAPLRETAPTYDADGNMLNNGFWGIGVRPENSKSSFYQASSGATQQTCYIPTGLLTRKTYADSTHVDYSYTPDGKLASRIWARGVTTSYGYNDAGDLGSINVLPAPLTGAAPE